MIRKILFGLLSIIYFIHSFVIIFEIVRTYYGDDGPIFILYDIPFSFIVYLLALSIINIIITRWRN